MISFGAEGVIYIRFYTFCLYGKKYSHPISFSFFEIKLSNKSRDDLTEFLRTDARRRPAFVLLAIKKER